MAPPCYLALSGYFNRADWRSTLECRDAQTPQDATGSAQQSWLHLSLLSLLWTAGPLLSLSLCSATPMGLAPG